MDNHPRITIDLKNHYLKLLLQTYKRSNATPKLIKIKQLGLSNIPSDQFAC